MKKTWAAIFILIVAILSGCTNMLTKMEVDSGQNNCRNKTSGNSILIEPMIDMICDEACRPDLYTYRHGHTYNKWRCSDKDTLVCVCNR